MDHGRTTPEVRRAALAEFIDRLVQEIEPLHRAHNDAVWRANLTGDSEYERESAKLDAQIRKIFSRREPYVFLDGVARDGGVGDPLLERQLVLLLNNFRANQIAPAVIERMVALEKALEGRFNNFRAELRGSKVTDNQLRELLRRSDDVEQRRDAWEATKQIGREVVTDLLELVGLRNDAARGLGFENYYSMMLELDELDETWLFETLDALERGTRPLFETYKAGLDARLAKRFGIEAAALRPWHYGDPFFQEAPVAGVDLDRHFTGRDLEALTANTFSAVGLDIGELLRRADLYERPGKSQHAFCLSVDREDDVRVLCNVRPNEFWMSTLLHEFGHAVYDVQIDRGLPFLLRAPSHTLTTEASAMLFGRLSKNTAWLVRHAGVDPAVAEAESRVTMRAIREQLLVQTRWELVMCHMERALYRDPGQDLEGLWWELVARFQHVRPPEGRRAPDWASKIHFSVAPVYYHNYALGEMMASQIQGHILHQVVGDGPGAWARFVESPEVGRFLVEHLYRLGKSLDWRRTIEHATGAALSPATFVQGLNGGS